MFGRPPTGPARNEAITRRRFLYTGASLFGLTILGGFIGRSLLAVPAISNFYTRALSDRNLAGPAITVYKMVPLAGCRYAKADVTHMASKIFPNIEAARARRQHARFFYGLKSVTLTAAQVNGMDAWKLFCGRKDWDARVAGDVTHWQRLGINTTTIWRAVQRA
jgi:hypothetical protein